MNIIIRFLLLLIIFSCNRDKEHSGDIDIDTLKERSIEISTEDFKSLEVDSLLHDPMDIEIINGKIFISDAHSVLSVLDLNNPDHVLKPFRSGKGPNEFIFIVDLKYSRSDSIVYLFDGMITEVRSFREEDFGNDIEEINPIKIFKTKGMLKMAILNDSTLVSTGLGKGRFAIHDMIEGDKLKEVGNRPKERYYAPGSKMGATLLNNQADIFYAAQDSMIFLSYARKPLLEGYKVTEDSSGINILPAWSVNFINKDLDKQWDQISQAEFVDSQVVGGELYALYTDKQKNYLLIRMSSSGEVTRSYRINFERDIKSFSFDSDGKSLYVLAETKDLNTDIFSIELEEEFSTFRERLRN
ncbi:6-bladed beta-propeller [Membranihabitans maritimus]|uniref:6-bladed beta-propeller n=1 Tax=Membranihabitans maritimus TaxID=2904244 RepID=UPI001F2D86F5|nr:6-bladed beta-propeller [Membranihabitans maritimus]